MSHEPKLYSDGPQHYWFECSCGWMGDARPNVFGASIRWKLHMDDVATQAIRDAVAKGSTHAVDI